MKHGTIARYYSGCRCEKCKEANKRKNADYRERQQKKLEELSKSRDFEHGTEHGCEMGCKCDACMDWKRESNRRKRASINAETPEERKRSNDAWRRRFEAEWGLA